MTINWKTFLPYLIPTLILLVAIHNSPQVQNILYEGNIVDNPYYITIQNTRNAYISDTIDKKYLEINTNPDTIKYFNVPSQIIYGRQATIELKIDGIEGYRNIKIFLTDPNNIIRFADDKTANYINSNIDNKSRFEIDSHQVNIDTKILINLNIPPSNNQINEGENWKINIIILKENGEISSFISKSININNKELHEDSILLYNIIMASFTLILSIYFVFVFPFKKYFK